MKKKITAFTATAVLLAVTILISFGAPLGVPTWRDVYSAFGFTNVSGGTDGQLSVHFLNVGCADSIFIHCGGYNVLIDSGNKSLQSVPVRYMKENGVESLDLVIATHPDKDHIGGMSDVVEAFAVKRFWTPRLKDELVPDADFYTEMLAGLSVQNTAVHNPQVKETLKLGEMVFTVLSPSKQYNDTNDSSVVVKLKFHNNSFLFTGDAEKKAEKDMLKSGVNLKADVLKVGHHGSKSSSSKEFLKAAAPQYAVISVGHNSYGLPKKPVIKRLEKQGAQVFRTDQSGTVVFYSDGEHITVEEQRR